MNQKDFIQEAIEALASAQHQTAALVGFDGYIDTIRKVVKEREAQKVSYFPTISDFADRIAFAAGKSAQLEVVSQTVKFGGNAPLMASSLGALGFQTNCIGTIGDPEVHPIFSPIPATLKSLGPAAETTAYEFNDGKLIVSDMSPFENMDWARLTELIVVEEWIEIVQRQRLMAIVGLSNQHHGNDMVRGILQEVIPHISYQEQDFFFDIADPSRKSHENVKELLAYIGGFSDFGKVTLGVNQNEAIQLYRILSGESEVGLGIEELAQALFKLLKVNQLLVHPIYCAILVTKDGHVMQEGRMVKEPKVLTGAGDHLNAGFCLGMILGCSHEACLNMGMANSGAYISLGYTPGKEELKDYLERWRREY